MFTSDVLESRQNSITLKSMDPKSVELLIEFAYTAQIRITEENVQDVLPVSCILQICPVKKACCDFIQSQLDPSNCIGIIILYIIILRYNTVYYNTRNAQSFRLPLCRTNTRKFSIYFQGPNFYNSLNSDITSSPSSASFKRKLKEFLLSRY